MLSRVKHGSDADGTVVKLVASSISTPPQSPLSPSQFKWSPIPFSSSSLSSSSYSYTGGGWVIESWGPGQTCCVVLFLPPRFLLISELKESPLEQRYIPHTLKQGCLGPLKSWGPQLTYCVVLFLLVSWGKALWSGATFHTLSHGCMVEHTLTRGVVPLSYGRTTHALGLFTKRAQLAQDPYAGRRETLCDTRTFSVWFSCDPWQRLICDFMREKKQWAVK